jgi:tellurite resistance protein
MSFDPAALLKALDDETLEALVDCMLLAAHADGEVSEQELDQLVTSIQTIVRGAGGHAAAFSQQRLGELFRRAQRQLTESGRAPFIDSVKQRLGDGDGRKAALGLAIKVTAADGIMRTSERELIFDLADGLEVDRDEAADLVAELTRK